MVRCVWTALAVVAIAFCTAAVRGETVLLDFTSPHCGPCQQMLPVVDRLAAEGVDVRKIDVSKDPATAQRFGVTRWPTFIVLIDGREAKRATGAMSYEDLRGMCGVITETAAPAAVAAKPQAELSAEEMHMLRSTVRIKVIDSKGHSYGTGTIIDTRQGEALVLTCGHLFRTPDGKTPQVVVETFDATPDGVQVIEQLTGEIISFDLNRDVGLVSVRPKQGVHVARVAASQHGIDVNARVWNVGCNQGQDPTVRSSLVTALDRYHGPPNIETSGAPVVGRSGGPLFSSQGEVIGVCYAADEPDDEGLYAGLGSLHAELDKLGLSDIYRAGTATSPFQNASNTAVGPSRMVPVSPLPQPVVRGQDPASLPATSPTNIAASAPAPPNGLTAAEQATLEEISKRATHAEVICIVRPHEPSGRSEVITLQNASPAFVAALSAMQQNQTQTGTRTVSDPWNGGPTTR
ncbi:MAG: trypsin-like peptidase domain-containing protein [Pirellulales bacterium]